MTEMKWTKEIHEEVEELITKAYKKGYDKGIETLGSCSWEKGVTDAWECVCNTLNMMGKDHDIKADERATIRAVAHTLETSDPVDSTKSYVEFRNAEEDEEIEVGDLVTDPSGNECIVTNIDTHIHVIYTDSLKTHKWKLDTEFKPTGLKVVGFGRIDR